MFVDIKTKEVLDIFQLKQRHLNICFPDAIDEESLKQLGYAVIRDTLIYPDYDYMKEKLVCTGVECIDGEWYNTYAVEQLPEDMQLAAYNHEIDMQIQMLEVQITGRRMREAVLTEQGKQWLADIEEQISKCRKQYKKSL